MSANIRGTAEVAGGRTRSPQTLNSLIRPLLRRHDHVAEPVDDAAFRYTMNQLSGEG